jgi:hypothetical protein
MDTYYVSIPRDTHHLSTKHQPLCGPDRTVTDGDDGLEVVAHHMSAAPRAIASVRGSACAVWEVRRELISYIGMTLEPMAKAGAVA